MLNVNFETFLEERYWFYLRKMLDKLIEWGGTLLDLSFYILILVSSGTNLVQSVIMV
jgi:hypothetical protein